MGRRVVRGEMAKAAGPDHVWPDRFQGFGLCPEGDGRFLDSSEQSRHMLLKFLNESLRVLWEEQVL